MNNDNWIAEIAEKNEEIKQLHLENQELCLRQKILEDWKYMAQVLLIIFLIVLFVGTTVMFLGAPHILKFVDQDKTIENLRNHTNHLRFRDLCPW